MGLSVQPTRRLPRIAPPSRLTVSLGCAGCVSVPVVVCFCALTYSLSVIEPFACLGK